MYTLKLLILTAAACAVARPPGDEKKGLVPSEEPAPTSKGIEINPKLREMLLEDNMLPEYLMHKKAPGTALITTTPTPDRVIHENTHTNEISEHNNDGMVKPTIIFPNWMISPNREEVDKTEVVDKVVVRSFLKQKPEPKPTKETSAYWPIGGKDGGKLKLHGIIEGDVVTFAFRPNDDGYYGDEADRDDMTELIVMDEDPIDGIDLEKLLRQGEGNKFNHAEPTHEPVQHQAMTLKRFYLPMSLVPPNLRWLEIDKDNNVKFELSDEEVETTVHTSYNSFTTTPSDNDIEPIYGFAVLTAICMAISMAIIGFVYGWNALSKKAKAAAAVDYPAYGVTGPSVDPNGDGKLAHSAHMYHYQHQKQQIIAMEKSSMEARNPSISDQESDDENDDGDYTVYECPGLATTGDMEVKNPMFDEEPAPGVSGVMSHDIEE